MTTYMPWIIAVLVVIIVGGVAIKKLIRAITRPEMIGMDREQVEEQWKQIEQVAEQGMMGAKLAVIEADKLLDNALKSLMMSGETLGERLKFAAYKYPKIRQVWPAHKIRNQLVHDTAFQISSRQAKEALRGFHEALETLNIL